MGDAVLETDAYGADEVFARARQYDTCRLYLIDARVGGVQRLRNPIESNFSRGVRFEIALQPARVRRHSGERPCRSRSSPLARVPPPLLNKTLAASVVSQLVMEATMRLKPSFACALQRQTTRRSWLGDMKMILPPCPLALNALAGEPGHWACFVFSHQRRP